MTTNSVLFYVVYLSQVLVISLYVPSRLLHRARGLIETFPPAQYPKLYPEPLAKTERQLRVYRNLNAGVLLLGLALLAAAWLFDYEIAAAWMSAYWMTADSGVRRPLLVYVVYSWLQVAPIAVLALWGLAYYKRMRAAARDRIRTAELKARRFFDFVSPALLATAVAMYVGAAVSLYVDPFSGWPEYGPPPFPRGTTITVLTLGNLMAAGSILFSVYGKKHDPHQTHADRARQIRRAATTGLVVSIYVSAVFTAANVLRMFELLQYALLLSSLGAQVTMVLMERFALGKLDPASFEVYKAEPNSRTLLTSNK